MYCEQGTNEVHFYASYLASATAKLLLHCETEELTNNLAGFLFLASSQELLVDRFATSEILTAVKTLLLVSHEQIQVLCFMILNNFIRYSQDTATQVFNTDILGNNKL